MTNVRSRRWSLTDGFFKVESRALGSRWTILYLTYSLTPTAEGTHLTFGGELNLREGTGLLGSWGLSRCWKGCFAGWRKSLLSAKYSRAGWCAFVII